jgi:two-component system uhpT operon response regulator UhpA
LTLLIADDHFAVREGLKSLLLGTSDLAVEVVGMTATLAETRSFLARNSVDLVLLDIGFPDGNGLTLIPPEGQPGPKFLVLSMYNQGNFVLKALQAGASGYIAKDSAGTMLVEAVRTVTSGGVALDPASLAALATHLRTLPAEITEADHALAVLSVREKEVFYGLLRGNNVKELASTLELSHKTVENHRSSIYLKLGLKGFPDLVLYARENHLF